jgi:preprotein translocase subunit SecA
MLKWLGTLVDSNEKELNKLRPLVQRINSLEPVMGHLTPAELRAKTDEFKSRLSDGQTLEQLLPEAFAAVREAARRTIGERHFDVQLMGGIGLHQGKIAEMKTGEGKTLVATMPLYLNSLTGRGCHLVTVNDYLAKRDPHWMGPIFHALGVSVASIQHDASFVYDPDYDSEDPRWKFYRPVNRRQAYEADITYGTNNEFGFDYLRDNMVVDLSQCAQRPLNYGIVDEVDNILIDEARTPLIISGMAEESARLYVTFAKLVPQFTRGEDFTIDEKTRTANLSEAGIARVEKMLRKAGLLKGLNLYDPANYNLTIYLENALRAQFIFKRDRDYVVKDGQVIIVDEFTGRLMLGRRYSEGLHQAIEAKEGVRIQPETRTMATITFQNYFRLYQKLAGMTGTAVTEAEEFHKIYKLEVVVIPTDKPMIRNDYPDQVYRTEEGKFRAVVREIEKLHQEERPVLIGTVSIEKSEHLSEMMLKKGIPHQVLNAKQHEREAEIIRNAGEPGMVTVATNMAGRGVLITSCAAAPVAREIRVAPGFMFPWRMTLCVALAGTVFRGLCSGLGWTRIPLSSTNW